MAKVFVAAFSISLDGFGAGPHQDLQNPLGVRGRELHNWFYPTAFFKAMTGQSGGETGIDNDFATKSFANVGAWILGRNMFGPVRGPWVDDASAESWKGWWGPNPPYHCPVFVLTHHARQPLVMEGGTTFHFVTDGIESALRQAKEAVQDPSGDPAKEKDVRISGGVSVVRQYVAAQLIDELHLPVSPVLLGAGEPLFAGISFRELGYEKVRTVAGEKATHVLIERG